MVHWPDWSGFNRVWEEKPWQQQIQTTLSGNNGAKGNQKYGETGGEEWIRFFKMAEIIACLFADRNNPVKKKIDVEGQKLKQFLEQMTEEKGWIQYKSTQKNIKQFI